MENNAIYDKKRTAPSGASYFSVWPFRSVKKNILLMYNVFLFNSISTRLAFAFVSRNCMKQNMILFLLSTLSCQVNT